VPWNDERRGEIQEPRSARVQPDGVGRVGVLDRGIGRPPRVGEDNESIVGSRKCRDVLVSVSAHVEQEDVRREVKPVRLPVGPQITLVDGPVVMKPGAWEERSVDRVVRLVVREDDVGDVVGPEPRSASGPRIDRDPGTSPGSTMTIVSESRIRPTVEATR
jgi:hypothetical protein